MSRRLKPTASYLLFLLQLIEARRTRNVSQDELAKRLGLSPTQVEKFENGERQLDFVQTREWCLALGVSFLDFMVKLDEEITAQIPDATGANESAPATDADQTEGGAQ